MDTKLLPKHKFNRMIANILSILVILAVVLLTTGGVYAQEPSPWLIAFPENDAVEGWEWPEGATVYLTIDNAPEGFEREGTAEVTSWGDPRTYVRFEFWEEYDLQVGDMVTLTDEFGTSTTHEVQPLSITDVDMGTDIVTGTADVGAQLQVWVHEQSEPPVDVTASDGTWQADLTDVYDITYGTGGRAWIIVESGNATAVDWYVPNPHFTVFPEWEFFDGLEWPDEATVTITVAGKPECATAKESWDYFFNGNFGEGCDIQYGDEVTFTDGTTTRMHTVQKLYVTDVDVETNTVSGKAEVEAGTIIYVWAHDGDFEPLQSITTGSDEWNVNLSEVYTIRDDSEGRSEIRDDMGNATASDWHVTHPHFTVFPEWEWFDGWDWPNEAEVTITVAGKPECETAKESWGYFFNGNFGEGCDIEFGDEVTFTDGETVRTHTVQNLVITKVNHEDDIVKGTADARAEIHVWPHATGQEQLVFANPKGKWNVDFTGIYDLKPGDGGRAEIRDEIGNATAVDWNISNPRLMAFPAVDQIFGYYWPEGSKVNLKINDKHIAKATVQGAPWDPNDIMAFFDFGDLHDLAAGDIVMLSGHDMEIYYTVQNLTVTEVNEIENTVTGAADPGAVVMVYPFEYGDQPLHVEANENGDWFADFEEAGIDLVPGMCGRSDIFDEFTNSTTVDWCIPNPRIVASEVGNWFWTTDFYPGLLDLFIYEAEYEGEGINLLWSDQRDADEGGFVLVGDHGLDLVPGNYVVVSDGVNQKGLVLEAITVDSFDTDNDFMEGTAPAGRDVWVAAGPQEYQAGMWVNASGDTGDPAIGAWFADFTTLGDDGYDITEEMRTWSYAQIFDEDGDINEADPPPLEY